MLEIKILKPEMEQVLAFFFIDVAKGDYAQHYHPYDLTPGTARELCGMSGNDLYYVLMDSDVVYGHGMLRGWDEGYDIPSLGIIIHPDAANKGLGSMFVRFLHSAAWIRGCSAVRLAVHKDNTPALKVYKKLGYVFVPGDQEELVGILMRDQRE